MTTLVFDFLREVMRERFSGSVTRLAEACDVSVQLAAKWVSENPRQRVNPSPVSCEKIAAGLGFDSDYVLGLAGHRKQRPDEIQPDDAELHAVKFVGALRRVPRIFWASVVDASVALANAYGDAPVESASAPQAQSAEGPVSHTPVPPVTNAQTRPNKRRKSSGPDLENSKHLGLALLGSR